MKHQFIITLCFYLIMSLSIIPTSYSQNYQNKNICCKLKTNKEVQLKTEVIITGLDHPWGLAFLPDNSLLVTERVGRLRVVKNKQLLKPIQGLPDIAVVGQGGLMDVVIDPNFLQNKFIYLSFTQADTQNSNLYGTAILRARLEEKNNTYVLSDKKIIFTASNKSTGGRHFGSRLVFENYNTLFATLGERGNSQRAQNSFDHAGSVIRIHTDGSIPQDNPFVNSKNALPEIFSTGHRNAQGAAFNFQTKKLWVSEHGAKGGDEINIIDAGKNYGWAVISYGTHYNNAKIGMGTYASGYEQPIYYWDPSIAPSGLTFYVTSDTIPKLAIPQWEGSLIGGALKYKLIYRLVLQDNKIIKEEHYLTNVFGRIRDVKTGTDGAIWVLTDSQNGQIIRVSSK